MGRANLDGDNRPRRGRGTPLIWALAIALGAVAVFTASVGWWLHDGRLAAPRNVPELLDWLDLPARGIQALLLSDIYYDDGISGDAEIWLQVGRITGGLCSLLIAGRLLFKALGDSVGKRLLSLRRDHVVIFGDGAATSEFVTVRGFGEVTQIAGGLEFAPGKFARAPAEGTLAQQASATAAGKARGLLVIEEDDERTWQTAVALARHQPGQEVIAVMRGLDHSVSEAALRSISYSAGVARRVMMAHPPYLLAGAMQARSQHILILGFGAIARALVREFVITCPVIDPDEMRITLVVEDEAACRAYFANECPGIADALDIAVFGGDLRRTDERLLEDIRKRQAEGEFCAVYLAPERGGARVGAAEALRRLAIQHNLFRAPIFWFSDSGAALSNIRLGCGLVGPRIDSDHERAALIARAASENRICELALVPFGSWRDALDGAGLFAPKLDAEARKIHETYLAGFKAGSGNGANQSPAARPWSGLAGEYRSSNRHAAAHIRAKAYAAGFDLNSWLEAPEAGRMSHELPPAADCLDAVNDELLDRISRLEHTRWTLERLLSGWTSGSPRNDFRKVHNMLRPYDELPDAEKRKDAAVVDMTRRLLQEGEGR